MDLLDRIASLSAVEREELSEAFMFGNHAYVDDVSPYLGKGDDLEMAWQLGMVAYSTDPNPFES